MNIRIGSFNCCNFGRNSMAKKDTDTLVKIIRDEKFDIIALQEIKQPQVTQFIVSKLNNHSPIGKWKGVSDNDCSANDYAYIWNSQRVDIVTTVLPDGRKRVFHPHIFKQYKLDRNCGQIRLARNPFYARFHTVIPGMPRFEFRLLNTHIRYSKGNAETDVGEIDMRRNEFEILSKNILPNLSDKVYGNDDGCGNPLTSYTILLGDYNLNLKDSGAGSPYLSSDNFEIPSHNGSKKIRTFQTELTTLKKPSNEDNASDHEVNIYVSNYDHFTYDDERFKGVSATCQKLDTVENYYNNDHSKHVKKLSDHVPIKLTFNPKER